MNYFSPIKSKTNFILFLVAFMLLHGFNTYNYLEFSILYKDPLSNLPTPNQTVQESPIQFLIGFLFLSSLQPKLAFFIVQLIGIIYLILSFYQMLNHISNKSYFILFYVIGLSPLIFILFTWFGKTDIFLIGSCFGILSCQRGNNKLILFHVLISIFAHIQIAFVHLIFLLYNRIIKPTYFIFVCYFFCFCLYVFYLNKSGDFVGRLDFFIQNLQGLLVTRIKNPFFSIFSTFGWLWIIIYNVRSTLSKQFWFSVIICFLITCGTLDHTRIFSLISLPLVIYLCEIDKVEKKLIDLSKIIPINLLIFFQFGVQPYGSIHDTSWGWVFKDIIMDVDFSFIENIYHQILSII